MHKEICELRVFCVVQDKSVKEKDEYFVVLSLVNELHMILFEHSLEVVKGGEVKRVLFESIVWLRIIMIV